jgi:RNA polymerase sigma-70 factor (ECF subfamily)
VDDEGFDAFYEREHPRLRRSLWALTQDLEVATEATDEAFARAVGSWSAVRNMDYPAAWVHRVGINLVNRRRRRHRHEQTALRRAELPPAGLTDDHREVWDAVAALPARQRVAIVLRYLADLPEPAIALAMGVSRGTVASTLSDARHRLGHLLADDDPVQEAPYA